jgi:hypothetical protein
MKEQEISLLSQINLHQFFLPISRERRPIPSIRFFCILFTWFDLNRWKMGGALKAPIKTGMKQEVRLQIGKSQVLC